MVFSVDRAQMRTIAGLRDEAGVLSVYVSVDPQQESASSPAWQVHIRNELSALLRSLRGNADARRLAALRVRLSDLEPVLDGMLDAATGGRGRALFAPLGQPEVHTLSMQLPLTNRVVLDPSAHLRPLVEAFTVGAPAGIVAVGAHGIRAIDYRFGLAHEIWSIPYEQPTAERRELTGPGVANPALGQRSASQRDLYARRMADHLVRFLGTTGSQLADVADKAGWEDLVVTGDGDLVAAVVGGLPNDLAAAVVTAAYVAPGTLAPAQVSALAVPEIAAARQVRGRRLAEQARDAALAGGPGAYGLADTLTALGEGRVTHLLLDRSGRWSGARAPDGRLCPHGEIPPGTTAGDLIAEPDLAERMIEEAYRHGGDAALLDPAPEALAAASGVAAILRW